MLNLQPESSNEDTAAARSGLLRSNCLPSTRLIDKKDHLARHRHLREARIEADRHGFDAFLVPLNPRARDVEIGHAEYEHEVSIEGRPACDSVTVAWCPFSATRTGWDGDSTSVSVSGIVSVTARVRPYGTSQPRGGLSVSASERPTPRRSWAGRISAIRSSAR